MKKHYQQFCNNLLRLSLIFFLSMIPLKSISQQNKSFAISTELTEKIMRRQFNQITIFHVSKREIQYHTADTSAKTKENYKYEFNNIEKNKEFKDSNNSFQQNEYNQSVIKIEEIKKIIAEETKFDTIKKRVTLMLDNSSISIGTLSGDYILMPNKYMYAISNIENELIANELTDKPRGHFNLSSNMLTLPYTLIQKVGTNDYYFIMSNEFIKSILDEKINQELLDIVHKLGYKEYHDYDRTYIKSKTAELNLDVYTYNQLHSNPSYIKDFDNDHLKIATIIKQTVPISATLNKYLNLYNIYNRKIEMSKKTYSNEHFIYK